MTGCTSKRLDGSASDSLSFSTSMATLALKSAENFLLVAFIIATNLLIFFNLTSGLIFGEYYNTKTITETLGFTAITFEQRKLFDKNFNSTQTFA